MVGMISRPSSIERKVHLERLNGMAEKRGLTPVNKEEKTFKLLFNVTLLKKNAICLFFNEHCIVEFRSYGCDNAFTELYENRFRE